MTGSRPCPRRETALMVMGASESMAHGVVSKDGHLGSKRGGTGLQSASMVDPVKKRVPHSSPLFKRTFSPPGKEHDLS